ncbi:hypothetical protein Y1Q_0016546 [Alligator mississippiensis]|uniref:Uncharacterized protein n=1 Tax=Alligator mississippiensis TaxID=8496 RepID=A0A151N342_ALLMI|nr:hypothetical protein Y1Q_0016546 [Alligator mississippiensis]
MILPHPRIGHVTCKRRGDECPTGCTNGGYMFTGYSRLALASLPSINATRSPQGDLKHSLVSSFDKS